MSMSTQTKISLGSVLAIAGALGMVLSYLLGWSEAPSPWAFLLAFVVGVLAGAGATLTVAGLIERRRSS
jgi:predicted ABC-type sugar transport system permease subunit